MNKKATILISVLSVAMLLAVQFMVEPVAAQVTYQDITGKLGGADYLIRIPSNWQGSLVVFCVGYTHDPLSIQLLKLIYANGFSWLYKTYGVILAMSNYGEGGMCVSKGVIRTHQLTEYIIDNYGVTGKVYLFGTSMGGDIALLLGDKYPHLYDGVFEAAGIKDMTDLYNLKKYYLGITDDVELAAAILAHGGSVPPCPLMYNSLDAFRKAGLTSMPDMELECGGTPEEKPKTYERISPIFSALDIRIPTITVHGDADSVLPYAQSLAYLEAVTQAGHSGLYRLYKAAGCDHLELTKLSVPFKDGFAALVNWVENGIPAPPSTP